MLSTRDVPQSSGTGLKKTLSPGNHTVRIYDVELAQGYNPGSMKIILRVEGPNLGPDFDGFLVDPNNPGGAKFAGQVGKISMQRYAYEDKTFQDGTQIKRDNSMLKAIDLLSTACGVQQEVKAIDASDWNDMIRQIKRFVVNKQLSVCLAGREYTNKSGYKEYELFFPKSAGGKYPFTAAGDPHILTFTEADHIIKEKESKTVEGFAPAKVEEDFNLF